MLACIGTGLRGATSPGPNILSNSSFEGGREVWQTNAPFSMVNDPTNAHSGSWELQAALTSTPSSQYCYQDVMVWPKTNYVATIWIKGTGTLQFGIQNTANQQNIASVNVVATGAWQTGHPAVELGRGHRRLGVSSRTR